MASEQQKIPAIFRKPLSREVWEKKYISRIYLPEDREFLESLIKIKDDEVGFSVEGISRKDQKRLKELGKVIKANRNGVSIILLIVLFIIALGITGWQIFLKDAVVKRFIETRLEQVFLADVETGGLDLSLLKGVLQINNMTIADAQNPMTNLVEFDGIRAEIDITALLKGKIHISELGFTGFRRGTDRKTSGALDGKVSEKDYGPATQSAVTGEEADRASSDLISNTANSISALIGEIDVEAILEQQKENLVSFGLIEEASESVGEWTAEWGTLSSEWSGRASEWEAAAKSVAGINTDSFSSISSAQSTIAELQGAWNRAGRDYNEILKLVSQSEQKIGEASAMMEDIQEAVSRDLDYVESLISLPEEGQADWAASIIEQQLGLPVLKYLDYFRRGTDFYERFKSVLIGSGTDLIEKRRAGRSLPSGDENQPGFLLEHAFASGVEEALNYQADLYNITDLTENPYGDPRFNMIWESAGSGNGEADISGNGAVLNLTAMPFDLGGSLLSMGIGKLSGELGLESDIALDDENISGNLNLTAASINMTAVSPDDFLYRLIRQSLDAVIPLVVTGDFSWSETAGLQLHAKTELDDQLGNLAALILEESAGEGIELLKTYLEKELALPLEDLNAVSDKLLGYAAELEIYQEEINSYMNLSEDKMAEIESMAAGIVQDELKKQLEKQLGSEASDQIDKAVDDVKAGIGGLLGF